MDAPTPRGATNPTTTFCAMHTGKHFTWFHGGKTSRGKMNLAAFEVFSCSHQTLDMRAAFSIASIGGKARPSFSRHDEPAEERPRSDNGSIRREFNFIFHVFTSWFWPNSKIDVLGVLNTTLYCCCQQRKDIRYMVALVCRFSRRSLRLKTLFSVWIPVASNTIR